MKEPATAPKESDVPNQLRRHIRILGDIGRLAGDKADLNRFLDQFVVQIARAVEIHHVKVLQYRPHTTDLLVVAGMGWKEGIVGATALSTDMRSARVSDGRTGQHQRPQSAKGICLFKSPEGAWHHLTD